MNIDLRSIDSLQPYTRNPRRNDNVVQQMVASIGEYGFKISLPVRSDGEVIDGLRLKVANELQFEQIPVIVCDEWTPAQVKAFRLVNRSARRIWNKGRAVLTRTHYWDQHEPCWYVRKKNAPWYGKAGENATVWDSPSPKFVMGSSGEEKFDHPT
jgi:hypothetical protein